LLRPVQLRLLGEFDVAVADVNGTRAINYNKPRLLLALLALAQGKPYTRAELADMLWPDELRDGRANLRHALFVLRRLFAPVPDVWLGTSGTLALNPQAIMVDVLAITGSAGYETLTLEQRLSYDRGRLLEYAELPESPVFASWRTSWQSRIEREISECRKALLTRLLDEGRHGDALEHAKLWVQAHPDDEGAHRHLIRLLRDSGNREAAQLAYEDCIALMRERYDTEPSEETRALMETPAAAPAQMESLDVPEQRQYRPLAILAVILSPDEQGLHPEQMLHGLQMARKHLVDLAHREGCHVMLGLASSLVIVFGYPALSERPTHAAARLACGIRQLALPPGVRVGMGLHADIALVQSDERPDAGALVTQEAMRLAYLAEAGEVIVSPSVHERLSDQFAVRDEKRHGRELCLLESQLETQAVRRMFGRVREFDTLVHIWARLPIAQPPTAMMMRGEPGIGKSLLAGVMAEYVRRTGGEVCLLACHEGHGDTPFHPVREYLLRRLSLEWGATDVADLPSGDLQSRSVDILCKRVGLGAGVRTGLKRMLFPESGRGEGGGAAVGDTPRETLVDVLATILAHHDEAGRPRLLIWEDLHWADQSSLALIEALMRRVQRSPMMLLATAREEFTRTWDARDMVLRPLERQAMAELVVHRSRGQRLAPKLRAQIVEGAEGIPLYAEEMVRQIALGTDVGVTPVIADLIAARLSALDPAARRLVQFAAVAGRLDDVLLTRAAEAAGFSRRDIPALLGELHRRGLIDEGVPANFRHELIRAAIYQTLSPGERRRQHEEVAQYLIGTDTRAKAADPGYIALHLDQARNPEATHWWCLAVRDALAQSAVREAQALADRALAALTLVEDPAARRKAEMECQLLRAALFTAVKGGGSRETALAYARSAELQAADDGPQVQFQQQWGDWIVAFSTRPHRESQQIADRLHRCAEQMGDGLLLGWAQYAYGYNRLWTGDAVNAERWMRTCMQTLAAQPDSSLRYAFCGADGVSLSRTLLGLALTLQGREEEALASARAGVESADALNHPASRVLCLSILSKVHWLRGDEEATRETAERLARVAGQGDFLLWKALAQGWAGWARVHGGDAAAIANIESALQACREGVPVLSSNLELLLAQAHLSLDNPGAAVAALERAGVLIEAFGTEFLRGEYLCLLGDAWDRRGDGARAVACWRQAVTESRRLGLSLSARKSESRIWAGASWAA
jgi:DNA-binding SARP family transcriptional activator/tetratricopeptide (TPR) repeat protein